MTTISPNHRRKARGSRNKILAIGILLLLCFAVAALLRSPLAGALWFVGEPLTQVRNAAAHAGGGFFAGFTSQQLLVAQNNTLKQEAAAARVALEDRNLLYAQNLELKSRLGRSELASSTHVVLAAVLSRPPTTPYDTLMLDVGANDAVAEGDLVAAGGSVYIGTVAEVHNTSSRVVLYSSPGEEYDALLLTHTASSTLSSHPVVVRGQGAGSLQAEVPAGVEVRTGDEVVFASIIPQLIARVTYVEKKNNSSFQTVFLQLPVNISSLQFVEVRKPINTYGS